MAPTYPGLLHSALPLLVCLLAVSGTLGDASTTMAPLQTSPDHQSFLRSPGDRQILQNMSSRLGRPPPDGSQYSLDASQGPPTTPGPLQTSPDDQSFIQSPEDHQILQNTSSRLRRPPPDGSQYSLDSSQDPPTTPGPLQSSPDEQSFLQSPEDHQFHQNRSSRLGRPPPDGSQYSLASAQGPPTTPGPLQTSPDDQSFLQSPEDHQFRQNASSRLGRPPPDGSLYSLASTQEPPAPSSSTWMTTEATTTPVLNTASGQDKAEEEQDQDDDEHDQKQFGFQDSLDYWDVIRESQISGFEASIEAAMSDVRSSGCREDTRELLMGLRNFTLWATQSNVYNMGDFDECLSVRGPHGIQGQYCLARVAILEPEEAKKRRLQQSPATPDPFAIWLDPTTSTWEQIEYKGARWRHRRDSAYWAMCVPASCSAGDLESVMNHVLPPLGLENGIQLQVNVQPHLCSHPAQGNRAFGGSDIAFCVILALCVITSISATYFDFHRKGANSRPTPLQALFLCFSMRKNFVNLHRATNKDGLKAVFGVRVLSMVMIIMCHKYGVTIGGATTNGQYIEEGNRQIPYMLTLHGDLVVDTFFAVGAFLLVYTTLKEWDSGKGAGLGAMFFLRYIRLTPAYALVIFFYSTLLNKVASGPLWNSTVVHEATFCARHWWTNLLYVSNYVNTQQMCMVQSWYLPCDMHYFVLSLPLLVLLHRRPRAGQLALALFALVSLIVPFAITLAERHDATLLFYNEFLSNPRASRYFHAMYIKSHTRAGPYVAGFIAGYVFQKRKLYETKITKATAHTIFAFSVLVFGAVLFPAVVFYTPEREYDVGEAAIYAALQRFAWGAAVALLLLSLASGKIRCVSTMLSWTPFVALGKLTYCAYLIHFTFQLIGLGADRNPNYVTNYNVLLKSTGETVFTFITALALYLMVEAPFRDIGRLFVLAANTRRKPRSAAEVQTASAGHIGPAATPDAGTQDNA